jgi:hypothetical protein
VSFLLAVHNDQIGAEVNNGLLTSAMFIKAKDLLMGGGEIYFDAANILTPTETASRCSEPSRLVHRSH